MSLFQRGVTNGFLNGERCICCLSTKEEDCNEKWKQHFMEVLTPVYT